MIIYKKSPVFYKNIYAKDRTFLYFYNNDFLNDKDYNKINMKTVVKENASTKKERKKDDNFEL